MLTDVSFTARSGDWVAVIGPNGAGKTTLIRCLAGLQRHEGEVRFYDQPLSELSTRQRAREIAVVPQHPLIPPGMRVVDYVLLGRTPHQRFAQRPGEADLLTAIAVLQRLDLDRFAERPVDQLSGGERQRTIVARALVQDAPLLLLDEPTTSLDIAHQMEVLELVEELRNERGLTVISTVHDLTLAGQFADQVVLLVEGSVVAAGAPAQVLTSELIARHFGVDVEIDHRDGVTVTVHRRPRERRDATRPPRPDSSPPASDPTGQTS